MSGRFSHRKRPAISDPVTSGAMRQVNDAISEVERVEILNGRYLTSKPASGGGVKEEWITLTNAAVAKLQHGMGRRVKGFIVCDLVVGSTTAGHFERVLTTGGTRADDKADLWIKPVGFSANPKVRIWCF